jgi:sulfate adenylyltransferase subunit 1 (EFTu-like GTPase family)
MAWYTGPTLVEVLGQFQAAAPDRRRPFRMPVQDVYKFTEHGDDRRIVAGTIESGQARVGDEIVFYPSGKRATIKSFEAFNRAASDSAAMRTACSRKVAPASVSVAPRVDRVSSVVPSDFSSRASRRLTMDLLVPSRPAAALSPPASATATNA